MNSRISTRHLFVSVLSILLVACAVGERKDTANASGDALKTSSQTLLNQGAPAPRDGLQQTGGGVLADLSCDILVVDQSEEVPKVDSSLLEEDLRVESFSSSTAGSGELVDSPQAPGGVIGQEIETEPRISFQVIQNAILAANAATGQNYRLDKTSNYTGGTPDNDGVYILECDDPTSANPDQYKEALTEAVEDELGDPEAVDNNPADDGTEDDTDDADIVDMDDDLDYALLESVPLIKADQVHASPFSLTGGATPVCLVDSGIDMSHQDLPAPIWGYNAQTKKEGLDQINDLHGHGTKMAGIVASTDGVAPGASLMISKVADNSQSGKFKMKHLFRAIKKCIKNKADIQARVILIGAVLGDFNNTVNSDDLIKKNKFAKAMHKKIEKIVKKQDKLQKKGEGQSVVFVGASGNYFNLVPGVDPLTASEHIITANATYKKNEGNTSWTFTNQPGSCTDADTDAGKATCFGNCSVLVDVAAPGAKIRTTGLGNAMVYTSGTSAAAAHVAGVAALLFEKDPTLLNQEVMDRIIFNADSSYIQGQSSCYGWGVVDALATVDY